MAKRDSVRPNRSNTNKHQEIQKYRELAAIISEWSELYYNKKGFLKVNESQIYSKYKQIRRILIKDFSTDSDMEKYIRQLPKLWLINPWLIPVVFLSIMVGFGFINEFFLKIFIGVTIKFRGAESDAIYVYYTIVMAVIFIVFASKMDRKNIMEKNMNTIYSIAVRKS